MIRVEGLTKRYGHRLVLRGVEFELSPGESLGIRGANGSGKSTLIQILAGRLRPTAGVIQIGTPFNQGSVSWLGHQPGVYLDFSARENLAFFSQLELSAVGGRSAVDKALEEMGLGNTGNKRVRAFSRGMKQRVALARLLVEGRSLWLLDEPSTGLDVASRNLMSQLIKSHQERGGACLVVSHHEELLSGVTDRILTLHRGVLGEGGFAS